MSKKTLLFLATVVIFACDMYAQKLYQISKTERKCLVITSEIDFEKEFEWEEVDCSELEGDSKKKITPEQLAIRQQNRTKLLEHQETLKSLGYNVDVTGLIDEKTIEAHKKYLKRKRKDEKRALKKNN